MTCSDLHSTFGPALSEKVEAEEAATPIGLDKALLAALLASPSNLPDEESILPVGPPPGLEHVAWLTYINTDAHATLPSQQGPDEFEESESSSEVDSEDDEGDMPLPPGFEHLKHSDANDLTADSTTDDAGTSSSDSSSEDESPGCDRESFKRLSNAPWRTRESKLAQTASKLPPWRSKTNPVAEPKVSSESNSFELPNLLAPPEYMLELEERAALKAYEEEEETVIWVSSRRVQRR